MEEIRGKENHFANSYVILTLVSQTIPKELLNLREILCVYFANAGFPGGSAVKNPPAMQEMLVPSLGWEDPLEKEMATHSSILAWEILWTREDWQATVHGITKSRTTIIKKKKMRLSMVMVTSLKS